MCTMPPLVLGKDQVEWLKTFGFIVLGHWRLETFDNGLSRPEWVYVGEAPDVAWYGRVRADRRAYWPARSSDCGTQRRK